MTILPKKKATKDKSDTDNAEHPHASCTGHPHPHGHNHTHGHSLNHPHAHGHYHHTPATDTRLEKSTRNRTSPTRWGPSTSREEKLPPRSLNGNGAFEFDFEAHDSPSNHKRRHRTSPHRTVRKHRGHSGTGQASPGTSKSYDCDDPYNSEDEHSAAPQTDDNREELELWFEQALKEKRGFIIKKMAEDGACLFRACADQIYGDQEMHSVVRKMCIDYMDKNADYFSHYVTEDFTTYLNRKRMDSCHGNNMEIQAMAELFNRPVEVYQYSMEPLNTFTHTAHYKTDNEPIRISYHGGVHYNSVVDPYKATIGVGLGLPGYQPGLADKNLMKDAMMRSEETHIEKTMLEDKMRETDWELTQESIEEQVARESYLQWLKEQETNRQCRASRSASATCSSSMADGESASPEARTSRSPRTRSGQNSPQHPFSMDVPVAGSSMSVHNSPKQFQVGEPGASSEGTSLYGATGGFSETSSIMDHIPPAMFGWDEDDILAQVMAVSKKEYLESLMRQVIPTASATATTPSATVTSRNMTSSTSMYEDEQACCSTSMARPWATDS